MRSVAPSRPVVQSLEVVVVAKRMLNYSSLANLRLDFQLVVLDFVGARPLSDPTLEIPVGPGKFPGKAEILELLPMSLHSKVSKSMMLHPKSAGSETYFPLFRVPVVEMAPVLQLQLHLVMRLATR